MTVKWLPLSLPLDPSNLFPQSGHRELLKCNPFRGWSASITSETHTRAQNKEQHPPCDLPGTRGPPLAKRSELCLPALVLNPDTASSSSFFFSCGSLNALCRCPFEGPPCLLTRLPYVVRKSSWLLSSLLSAYKSHFLRKPSWTPN